MAHQDDVERAVFALGREVRVQGAALAGGASGSGVYRVRIDGYDAVLKVSTADGLQRNARRELTFYQTLAERVPVATPRLLDHADNDDLTALVLSAHTPARPAREWDRSEWLEVAAQLAALHSIRLTHEAPWVHTPWLRRILDQPPIKIAEHYWSDTDAAASVGKVLDAPAALAAADASTPDCFLHGDFHVDNLLRDGNHILWADWQVAGIGSPAIDLAFLLSRANADGADPPHAAMLHEYTAHRRVDLALLHRAVIAAEIGKTLFGWPEYAAYHTQNERDRITRRLRQLIADWHILSA